MPTNVSVEYALAQEEYFKARTAVEKFAALKKMISTAPRHKGAQKLLGQLKRRLAELKKQISKEKKSKSGRSFAIKKEGAATIVFLGVGSKKSEVFAKLANTKEQGNLYNLQMRMIKFENVWLQGIDLPEIYEGFAESLQAGQLFDLIRNADFLIFVCKNNFEFESIKTELEKKISIGRNFIITESVENLEDFKKEIWQKLGKIRVQTKTRGVVAEKPLVLKEGATIKDLAEAIHKDFVTKFKYAKVWGPSAKFSGQQVGLGHKLKDKDIVEAFTK